MPCWGVVVCYNEITHQCQSKTLSPPDFESTYTNKASLRGFGGVFNLWGSFGFLFLCLMVGVRYYRIQERS